MQIRYFEDTDTLYLEFNNNVVSETRDFDENTLIELDKSGHLVGMTIEHAKANVAVTDFSFQHIMKKSA